MDSIVSRLYITQIFCEVDDLCQQFERHWQRQPQLLRRQENNAAALHELERCPVREMDGAIADAVPGIP